MWFQPLKKRLAAGTLLFLFLLPIIPSSSQGSERTEIRIGVINSVSGKESSTGKEIRWAYELAASDINKTGGIFIREYGKKIPVRLMIADDESDSAIAAKSTETLIVKEKVDLILGAHPSAQVISSCRMAEKYHVYYHATSCFIPKWIENHFTNATLLFFDLEQATEIPFKLMTSLPPEAKPNKLALLMEDTPDGEYFGACFKKKGTLLGYRFEMDRPLPQTREFLPVLMEMKQRGVDSLLVFGDPTGLITLVKAIKAMQINLTYFHGWKGAWNIEFQKALGADAHYVVCDGFWSEDYPYPGAQRLGNRFYENFGKRSVSIGLYYGSCQVLFQAIENAGSLNPEKILNSIVGREFRGTVLGDIRYDQKGVALIPSTAHQWLNGKQVWVYPFQTGSLPVKAMPPWDRRDSIP